jgi:hypothetical protein
MHGPINRSAIALLAATLILTGVGESMSALSRREPATHRRQPAPNTVVGIGGQAQALSAWGVAEEVVPLLVWLGHTARPAPYGLS